MSDDFDWEAYAKDLGKLYYRMANTLVQWRKKCKCSGTRDLDPDLQDNIRQYHGLRRRRRDTRDERCACGARWVGKEEKCEKGHSQRKMFR